MAKYYETSYVSKRKNRLLQADIREKYVGVHTTAHTDEEGSYLKVFGASPVVMKRIRKTIVNLNMVGRIK